LTELPKDRGNHNSSFQPLFATKIFFEETNISSIKAKERNRKKERKNKRDGQRKKKIMRHSSSHFWLVFLIVPEIPLAFIRAL